MINQDTHSILEHFGKQVLATLDKIVPSSSSCFYFVNDNYDSTKFVIKSINLKMVDSYEKHFYKIDPFHPSHFKRSTENVLSLDSLINENQKFTSEYYNDFLKAFGYEHETDIYLKNENNIVGGIALLREKNSSPFSNKDLQKLRASVPFMELSYNLCITPDYQQERFDAKNHYYLTRRELDIVKLLAQGKSNKEIGDILNKSPLTIKTHIQNLFAKTNVSSRTALVTKLFEAGISK